MDKWDAIENKVTEKKGSSKWVVILCVVAGVVLAYVLLSIAVVPVVDNYLKETQQIISLYDFYDLKIGEDQTAVYFIGSSVPGLAVYTPYINQHLLDQGYDITAYNLFVASDVPVQRSLEIQKIIDSSPSLVIYGVTYRTVTSPGWYDERVVLVHDRLNVRDDSLYLYSDSELEDLETYYTPYYKKKFLKSAISYSPNAWDYSDDYLNDPYGIPFRNVYDSTKNPEQIIKEANDPNDPWRPIVTGEPSRYKEALIYNVKTLQDAGIPVVIINMPLHPLTSEKITGESRQNFYDLLNETGAKWYDMEIGYGDEYFRDSHHMTFYGATQFAPVMADLIIEEVKSGAVHYA